MDVDINILFLIVQHEAFMGLQSFPVTLSLHQKHQILIFIRTSFPSLCIVGVDFIFFVRPNNSAFTLMRLKDHIDIVFSFVNNFNFAPGAPEKSFLLIRWQIFVRLFNMIIVSTFVFFNHQLEIRAFVAEGLGELELSVALGTYNKSDFVM